MTLQIDAPPPPEAAPPEAVPPEAPESGAPESGPALVTTYLRGPDVQLAPAARGERREVDAAVVVSGLNVYYGSFRAIRDIGPSIRRPAVTAILGPSGRGQSTFLRTLNRMAELTPAARAGGAAP